MRKGLFITFEGGDGSGKSTQIEILAGALEGTGFDVIVTREPGGTRISEAIRDLLLDPENSEISPLTEALLYASARAQIVDQLIRPALDEGKVVICDRFIDSSIAYQGYGRGLGDQVESINAPATADCMPDITFFMKIDPEDAKKRIGDRGEEKDRIEKESDDFHRKVAEGYEELEKRFPDRIVPIDASARPEEISVKIIETVMNRIFERQQ